LKSISLLTIYIFNHNQQRSYNNLFISAQSFNSLTPSFPDAPQPTYSMRTSTPNQIPASPYPFPFDSSLSPQTTALVVIDMQQDCMH